MRDITKALRLYTAKYSSEPPSGYCLSRCNPLRNTFDSHPIPAIGNLADPDHHYLVGSKSPPAPECTAVNLHPFERFGSRIEDADAHHVEARSVGIGNAAEDARHSGHHRYGFRRSAKSVARRYVVGGDRRPWRRLASPSLPIRIVQDGALRRETHRRVSRRV
jgi:hypothetical protein